VADPPIPSTPEELLAAAARLRIEAAVHAAEARTKLAKAEAFEETAGKTPLTIAPDSDTVQARMHVESAGAKRAAGQFTEAQLKHAFVAMLVRRGLDVGVVARKLEERLKRRVPRSTVQSWYKDPEDPNFRAPREDAVEVLKSEYGVPRSAWARVKAAPGT
jgi:hypothetical protein